MNTVGVFLLSHVLTSPHSAAPVDSTAQGPGIGEEICAPRAGSLVTPGKGTPKPALISGSQPELGASSLSRTLGLLNRKQ